jgi:hypothetical protein
MMQDGDFRSIVISGILNRLLSVYYNDALVYNSILRPYSNIGCSIEIPFRNDLQTATVIVRPTAIVLRLYYGSVMASPLTSQWRYLVFDLADPDSIDKLIVSVVLYIKRDLSIFDTKQYHAFLKNLIQRS